jgi:hypothetical protein
MKEGAGTTMAFDATDHSEPWYPRARHAAESQPGGQYPTEPGPTRSQPGPGPAGHRPPAHAEPTVGRAFAPSPSAYPVRDPAASPYRPVQPVGVHQPLPDWSVPEPSPFELALPDLRNKIVNRLIDMNGQHAEQAWARRRRDGIGAHALAFFYAEPPGGTPPRCELRTCARLFLAGDEQRLAMLLYELTGVAQDHIDARGDPRSEMANWCESMSANAVLVGVGVSSLDTPAGTWEQVQQDAISDIGVPGRCWVVLREGTRILVDRFAQNEFGRVDIQTTHAIRTASGEPVRRWRALHDSAADQETTATWQWLSTLSAVLMRGPRAK